MYRIMANQITGLTEKEFYAAYISALQKLQVIVSREGDANGKRWEPEYMALLIEEQIQSNRAYQASMDDRRERMYI